MKNLKLYKKNFIDRVVIVTGTHCSGKSMVAPIISSFSKVEHLRKIYTVDQILDLTYLKKIPLETAVFLVRHILDFSFYEQLIGRNMNFRIEDETSVFNSKNPLDLINRLNRKRGYSLIEKFNKNKNYFLMDTHDGLMLFDLWKKINPKYKFINIYRNPFNLAVSWLRNDLRDLKKNKLNQIIMLKNKNFLGSFYSKNQFEKMSEMDSIINMINFCYGEELKQFNKYKSNRNWLFLEFQDFAENTNKNLNKISSFLKIKPSKYTKKIMIKENCPRVIDPNLYLENKKKIKFLSSRKYYQKLISLENLFFKRNKYSRNSMN